jgi:hypothetical protein
MMSITGICQRDRKKGELKTRAARQFLKSKLEELGAFNEGKWKIWGRID